MSAFPRRARLILESEAARPFPLIVAVLVLWQPAVVGLRIPKYLTGFKSVETDMLDLARFDSLEAPA